MRITREALLRVAQDTINQRVRADRTLLAAFLCGSMLEDEYLLGETTDLDLFYIHSENVSISREIIPLTDEIHFDIAHYFQRDFRQTRRLRTHPWLGPTINRCRILHDPQHFLDFIQAGVRGQYDRSDYVLMRAHSFYEKARSNWSGLQTNPEQVQPQRLAEYFRSLFNAGNAIASLIGPPLTERNFLANFQTRAEGAYRPGLYPGFLGLLGTHHLDTEDMQQWIPMCLTAFDSISENNRPPRLHLGRRQYFLRALESWCESSQPVNALWLLLHTWTDVVNHLPGETSGFPDWENALAGLGLFGKDFEERLIALDMYLDQVDETLDDWAQRSGAALA